MISVLLFFARFPEELESFEEATALPRGYWNEIYLPEAYIQQFTSNNKNYMWIVYVAKKDYALLTNVFI